MKMSIMTNINLSSPIIVVTGHFGTGKTNIAVNLALEAGRRGVAPVSIVDLDIVNPFFRTADNAALLESRGIRAILPVFAGSNVDIPALSPEVNAVFNLGGLAVFDVGGDDSGAIALALFADKIKAAGYVMYYVVSRYRPLTAAPEAAAELLGGIEKSSGLKVTGIINNSNIGEESTAEGFAASFEYADRVAALAGVPVAAHCATREVWERMDPGVPPGGRMMIENVTMKPF
jgi:hypothetical protein